jgi:spermidine/putrescine transport system substrate-binding protein
VTVRRILKVLTWPDYIAPLTLQQFETEYRIHVELDIVPGAPQLVERMQAGDASVDVLVPPDYAVRELEAQHRLELLDHRRLTNLRHLEPRFRKGRAHDPLGRVSVIKDWGTTGFMYRSDVVHESPRSWADFWKLSAEFSGQVTVLDSPGEVIGAALKMRGHSYNAAGTAELQQARLDLLDLKPHLRAFATDYKPLLASGEACLSLGWNGDALALRAQGLPIRYVVPAEGSQIWEDDWAIARSAPNHRAALLFINFVLRPDIAAQEAGYTRYATGNRTALTLLPPDVGLDPETYPPADVLQRLESGLPLDEAGQARRQALWSEIRG